MQQHLSHSVCSSICHTMYTVTQCTLSLKDGEGSWAARRSLTLSDVRGRPLVCIGSIFSWGPCVGKVNEILRCMTAKPKRLHERHRCCIERTNCITSVESDAKPSPKVWQLQFYVNKTAKDSSPLAVSVRCFFFGNLRMFIKE